MKLLYALIGPGFFFFEILIYQIADWLTSNWYSSKFEVGMRANELCANPDAVGNCLDFKWHVLVLGIGLFGTKIAILIAFFVILFYVKKLRPALLVVISYSILILAFHFDIIPIQRLHDLYWRIELANVGGVISVCVLMVISLFTSLIFYYKKKNTSTMNSV